MVTLPAMARPRKFNGKVPGWAERIVACRTIRDMTQEEFCKQIGVSQQSLSYYERGINQPTIETWIRISDFSGESIDSLMRGQVTQGNRKH